MKHLRFNCSQAIRVEPLPPKTSKTTSFSLELDLIALEHNAIGLGVACPPVCFLSSWLVNHILKMDTKIGEYARENL